MQKALCFKLFYLLFNRFEANLLYLVNIGDKKGNNSEARSKVLHDVNLSKHMCWVISSLSRSWPRGLVTFGAPKVTQNALSRNASLPHKAFALQIRENLGCNLFAGLTFLSPTLHAKICYALQPHRATIVFPDFGRSLSAEEKKQTQKKILICSES